MKIIFLDFDGVLNSGQECVHKHLRRKRSWYWTFREWAANTILRVRNFLMPKRYQGFVYDFFGYLAMSCLSDHEHFCPTACSNIQYLLDEDPDLRIVVSSVWRLDGLKSVKRILKKNGIDSDKVIDVTPRGGTCRGDQIQLWLNTNEPGKVTAFAIIDDDADMAHLMPRLVQTDGMEGFMWGDVLKTVELLGTTREKLLGEKE